MVRENQLAGQTGGESVQRLGVELGLAAGQGGNGRRHLHLHGRMFRGAVHGSLFGPPSGYRGLRIHLHMRGGPTTQDKPPLSVKDQGRRS